jgi:uncharacterized membrane protein YhaH (DUF805 family)
LVNAIPVIGSIVVLMMLGCTPGTPGDNQYGPSPLK